MPEFEEDMCLFDGAGEIIEKLARESERQKIEIERLTAENTRLKEECAALRKAQ